jgi:substrate-binding family protein
MKRAVLWTALAALTFAGCSSTGTRPGDQRAGGVVPSLTSETSEPAAPEASTSTSAVGVPGSSPVASAPSGPRVSGGNAGRPRTVDYGPPGRGVTRSAIKVGVWVLNTDNACNATGVAGHTPGGCGNRDHVVEVNALTKWVNAHGGVAGRKLDVVVEETLADNSSWAAQAEAACEKFAVDEKVFMAIAEPQTGRPYFTRCMAKRGIPVIDPGPWAWDSTDYREVYPYIYQPSRPRADRWVKAYIDGLAARGFFKGNIKVGLFRYDSGTHNRVTKSVLRPRLAAHGIRSFEEAVIRTPASVAALGDMNVELANHILRFKRAGVNRVLFFVGTGEFHFFYFTQADSQDFTPRYGMSSNDLLTLSTENAPEGQLDGAVAVGWAPGFDTIAAKDPGLNAAAKTCKQALAQGGVNDPWRGRNVKCDSYFFLKRVLDRAPALNVRGVRAAVEAIGTSYEAVTVLAARFGPGRYDGPSRWRDLTYQASCSCFVYSGPSKSF